MRRIASTADGADIAGRRHPHGGAMVRLLGCGALFALALAAAGYFWFEREVARPYRGFASDSLVVDIAAGSSGRAILAELERRGVIADVRVARLVHRLRFADAPLRSGEYEFAGAAPVTAVLDKLVRGDVLRHPVTIPEGWDLMETAHHLAAQGFGSESALRRAMEDPAAIRDLDPRAATLEGYLFPDTYSFERGASEVAIVATMVKTFRQKFAAEVAPLAPWPPEIADLRALVALASLVEKETSQAVERDLVAGVYTRRLRLGMLLQADPTAIYAKKLRGTWDGNLRRADLEFADPYNTYRSPGLPPGPICSPGLSSLVAAARPRDEGFLYFVSRNDGTHVFARNLADHNANVLEWQKRYWQRRWAARGGKAGPSE
jgi:UPF0755 protein